MRPRFNFDLFKRQTPVVERCTPKIGVSICNKVCAHYSTPVICSNFAWHL